MTRLLHRHLLDEAPPVEPLRPVPATTRRPLRIDEPARSIAALAGLRTEAPVLDLRTPAAPAKPQPMPAWQLDAIFGLMRLNVRKTRVYASRYDALATKVEALLAELAELAPFTAKAKVA